MHELSPCKRPEHDDVLKKNSCSNAAANGGPNNNNNKLKTNDRDNKLIRKILGFSNKHT